MSTDRAASRLSALPATETRAEPASRYLLLKDIADKNSDQRRELLRQITDAMSHPSHTDDEIAELDSVLSVVAQEYSVEIRTQFARLVAASAGSFRHSAEKFAEDTIEIAAPVLRQARSLSDDALLRVVARKSQPHMLAVSQRSAVSPKVSHALVEVGDDTVVTSLLTNTGAQIADQTYEVVAKRAETSTMLQGPLVRRQGVPLDLLHDLYSKVEANIRTEIVQKFNQVPAEELDKAIERSRSRVTSAWRRMPEDYNAAQGRINALAARGGLTPAGLASLLREGAAGRTAFVLAFARLAEVDFGVVEAAVETPDLDTVALLSRGANFDRALFVTLALGLDPSSRGTANAEAFGQLYESVPVQAAQRAMRFWRVRTSS